MNLINYEPVGTKTGNLKITSNMQCFINDKNIDEVYSSENNIHVETIKVEGREMLIQDLETVVPKGLNGSQIISSQIKPRKLEVTFQVEADDESIMRNFYKRFLQDVLDLKSVKFSDENLYYFGRYTDYKKEVIKPTINIVTIEILCNDVFKYTDLKTVTFGSSETIQVLLDTQLPVKPTLKIDLAGDIKSFFVFAQDAKDEKNSEYVYFENSTFFPRTVQIDFKELTCVGNPGNSQTDLLHTIRIDSDVENFKVNNEDHIHISAPFSSAYLSYRGVYL